MVQPTSLKEAEVVIPMASMVDLEAEKKRLSKEIKQVQAEVSRLESMLSNMDFLTKAPLVVVDKERAKLASKKDNLKRLKEHLGQLKS